MSEPIEIGRVAQVNRYPVKSMRGEALDSIELRWHGFDGDRQYAFVKAADRSRFPWFTARDFSELVLFSARYEDASSTKTSAVRITTPDGETCEIGAAMLTDQLSATTKGEVRLLQLGRGAFDSMPISVVGRGTLDAIGGAYGRDVGAARFRPNIVIDSGREQDWLGKCLVFGDPETGPRLRVNKPIDRCVFVTIDPGTAAREPKLLRTVVEHFNNQVGVYCVPERLGTLHRDARVWIA